MFILRGTVFRILYRNPMEPVTLGGFPGYVSPYKIKCQRFRFSQAHFKFCSKYVRKKSTLGVAVPSPLHIVWRTFLLWVLYLLFIIPHNNLIYAASIFRTISPDFVLQIKLTSFKYLPH